MVEQLPAGHMHGGDFFRFIGRIAEGAGAELHELLARRQMVTLLLDFFLCMPADKDHPARVPVMITPEQAQRRWKLSAGRRPFKWSDLVHAVTTMFCARDLVGADTASRTPSPALGAGPATAPPASPYATAEVPFALDAELLPAAMAELALLKDKSTVDALVTDGDNKESTARLLCHLVHESQSRSRAVIDALNETMVCALPFPVTCACAASDTPAFCRSVSLPPSSL